ncbi:c-type cytochrome [Rhodocista pekingensis]|uniref:C-type cytochrome n=1 Tax=Rhodocista pekingensis TaxID=201185 RepID=A0ABW2KSW1_9PROT
MKKSFATLALSGLVALSASGALAQDGDPVKGEAVFKKCMACHRIGPDAKNLVGPVLTGVVGRQAGVAPGFSYSALNHAAGEAGLHWTAENIMAYLPDPNAFLRKFVTDAGNPDAAKGSTKMVFKLPNEQERKDVIAYLKTFSN